MKLAISIVWLIFVALFLFLGCFHWDESKKIIPPFEITKRELDKQNSSVKITIEMKGTELDKPLEDFSKDFNSYLEKQNQSAHTANRNAALGYFLASLTAFISLLLEWRDMFSLWYKNKKDKWANKALLSTSETAPGAAPEEPED